MAKTKEEKDQAEKANKVIEEARARAAWKRNTKVLLLPDAYCATIQMIAIVDDDKIGIDAGSFASINNSNHALS